MAKKTLTKKQLAEKINVFMIMEYGTRKFTRTLGELITYANTTDSKWLKENHVLFLFTVITSCSMAIEWSFSKGWVYHQLSEEQVNNYNKFWKK